jgi:transposase
MSINNDEAGKLESRWKTADQIAKMYGYSRPWVYDIADRFKIRTVSLAEAGKRGSRFFDSAQLAELIEELAEAQKGQPRINPRAKAKPALEGAV